MPASVLIVDDDRDIRESLTDMLAYEGYEVESVGSGGDALKQVRRRRYGAALLDIQLPDVDGLSVLKVMMDLDPKLPIIVLTGHANDDNTIGSLTRGAFAYLTKPYNSREIKAILRRAVAVKDLAVRAEHVEEALRASEDRFRALVESATDAIVLVDHAGHIIAENHAAERLFGYPKQDILGQPLSRLICDAGEPGTRKPFSVLADPSNIGRTIELTGYAQNGRAFPLELSLASWSTKEGAFFSAILRDITDRKRAIAEVERLSRQNQLLLNSAGDGIYGLDVHGRTTFVNPAAARMLSYDAADLIGKPMHAVLHHSYADGRPFPSDDCPIYATLKDGRVHHVYNEVFWRKDGTYFPVEYISTPILEHGSVQGAAVVFQDITERKRGEALQQTQLAVSHILASSDQLDDAAPRLLQAICDTVRWDVGLLWLVDTHHEPCLRCVSASRPPSGSMEDFIAASRTLTLPRGIGLPGRVWHSGEPAWVLDVAGDSNFARAEAAASARLHGAFAFPIATGGACQGVIEFFSREQREPDRHLMQMMLDTGIKVAQFIDRKRADLALREAYEETATILTSFPGAIILSDGTYRVLYANATALRAFTGAGRQVVGRPIHEVLCLDSVSRERLHRQLESGFLHGRISDQECDFVRDQRIYRYRLFPVAMQAEDRQQIGLVAWDVTEERQLRDQLLQAEKLTSLGTLVSGMAHEINNPAQAILSMAELIMEEGNEAVIRSYAADIAGYARHVSDVVRDFAAYARSSSRDGEAPVDLNHQLAEALKMVRLGPHFGYVEPTTSFTSLPPIMAKKAEIEQLFVNLISNAVQAMNGRGRLTLDTGREAGHAVVRISDTGCGIPKAILHKIFDPFFTTKDPGHGTGLGLSIVYKIVNKYGGTLSVESEEGKGTSFTIRFPVGAGSAEGGGAC